MHLYQKTNAYKNKNNRQKNQQHKTVTAYKNTNSNYSIQYTIDLIDR